MEGWTEVEAQTPVYTDLRITGLSEVLGHHCALWVSGAYISVCVSPGSPLGWGSWESVLVSPVVLC